MKYSIKVKAENDVSSKPSEEVKAEPRCKKMEQ